MRQEKYERLISRNNKIIEVIMNEINDKCKSSIDLVGITGSFCSGNINSRSNLNLIIIRNDDTAKILDKSFIFESTGFNITTYDWTYLEEISKYNDIFVSSLVNLEIIYLKDKNVLDKYRFLQNILLTNLKDEDKIRQNISYYFSNILGYYDVINKTSDLATAYRNLAKIIIDAERIIYMSNNSYVKGSIINIKNEIKSMNRKPNDFTNIYDNITNCNNIDEVKNKSTQLIDIVKKMVDDMDIKYNISKNKMQRNSKRKIGYNDLVGTYETLVSKYENKMLIAESNDNRHLSFVTMALCQDFYDEMYQKFYIPKIKLIDYYNPNYIFANKNYFNESLLKWLDLYNKYGVDVNYYVRIEDLDLLYSKKYIKEK